MDENKENLLKNQEKGLKMPDECDKIHTGRCNNENKKRKKGKCKMATLTANCDLAFVVDKEKTDEFLSVKPNKKIRSAQKIIAEQILKNIIIESLDDTSAKNE